MKSMDIEELKNISKNGLHNIQHDGLGELKKEMLEVIRSLPTWGHINVKGWETGVGKIEDMIDRAYQEGLKDANHIAAQMLSEDKPLLKQL